MVSALCHSSQYAKPSKPSSFDIGGFRFGWEAIENMFKRQIHRRQNEELPRVERLRESDVYPTAWTRLNVKRAKIMQVKWMFDICRHLTETLLYTCMHGSHTYTPYFI